MLKYSGKGVYGAVAIGRISVFNKSAVFHYHKPVAHRDKLFKTVLGNYDRE